MLGIAKNLKQSLSKLMECDSAQDVAEYAVLLAVVLIIVIATASALGTGAHTIFSKAGSGMSNIAH